MVLARSTRACISCHCAGVNLFAWLVAAPGAAARDCTLSLPAAMAEAARAKGSERSNRVLIFDFIVIPPRVCDGSIRVLALIQIDQGADSRSDPSTRMNRGTIGVLRSEAASFNSRHERGNGSMRNRRAQAYSSRHWLYPLHLIRSSDSLWQLHPVRHNRTRGPPRPR